MARSLDAAIVTELSAAVVIPVWFVKLDFDGGAVYLHSDLGSITTTTPSATWTGTGDFGSIEELEETADLVAVHLKMSLSGIDATILTEALSNDYWERDLDVYVGFRDTASGAMVSDPHGPFSFFITTMEVAPSRIDLTAAHEMDAWDRPANEYYTDAHQRRRYSGDTFLQFVPRMRDLVLRVGDSNHQGGFPEGNWRGGYNRGFEGGS